MERNSSGTRQVPRWLAYGRLSAGLGLLLAMSGCGTADCSDRQTTLASPSAAVPTVVQPVTSARAPAASTRAPLPDGSVCTVAQVVAIAREHTPTREVLDANRAAAKAAVLQAQTIANPEVEFEGGQGRPRNGDSTEAIGRITLRQRLELRGKRSSRVYAAEVGMTVAEQDALALNMDLEAKVREALHGGIPRLVGDDIVELVHDSAAGKLSIYITGEDNKPYAAEAKPLIAQVKVPGATTLQTVTLQPVPQSGDPAGKASMFTGSDLALAGKTGMTVLLRMELDEKQQRLVYSPNNK